MFFYIVSIIIFVAVFGYPLLKYPKDPMKPSSFIMFSFCLPQTVSLLAYWLVGEFSFHSETMILSALLIVVMSVSYFISYQWGISHNGIEAVFENLYLPLKKSIPRLNGYLATAFMLYLSLLVLLIYLVGLNPLESPLWFRIKASHDYGIFYAPFLLLPVYMMMLAQFLMITKQGKIQKICSLAIIVFVVIHAIFSGSRATMIQVFFGLLVLKNMLWGKRITYWTLLLIGLLMTPVFVFYNIYRISGITDYTYIIGQSSNPLIWAEVFLRFDVLFNSIRVVDEFLNGGLTILYGQSVVNAFYMFIPRFLYPDKPLFFNMDLHKYFSNSRIDGPLDFSSGYMMAEAFLNFHLLGVLLYSLVWGFFMAAMDKRYTQGLSNHNVAAGFMLFYIPAFYHLTFIQDGLNGMFTQWMVIIWAISQIFLFSLRLKWS